MKVTFVTPRYGVEVVGGAEHAARMLAERLVSQLRWDVRVLTSCAKDAATWRDEYAPGEEVVNDVRVQRFSVQGPRHENFLHTSALVHANPRLAAREDQERWIDEQGPTCPGLLDALREDNNSSDVVVFYPYLYYPIVRGLPLVAHKSVLHPAAHDEVPLRMSIYQQLFHRAAALVFQTEGERALVENIFHTGEKPQLLLGLGVEPQQADPQVFRTAHNLGDRPFLLCLGRIDGGKGSHVLARYFAEFKSRRKSDLALCFAGPQTEEILSHDDIFLTGVVSDEMKWSALHGATALISPSSYEAFSLVLLEAWSAAKPVLVNGACIATAEHVGKSGGGFGYHGYAEFEAQLDRLLRDNAVAAALGNAGFNYVQQNYLWPSLIEQYAEFLKTVAERSTLLESTLLE